MTRQIVSDWVVNTDILEFEFSREFVLGLLQLLSAPHMLVVDILNLCLHTLQLSIELRERGGEKDVSPGTSPGLQPCCL